MLVIKTDLNIFQSFYLTASSYERSNLGWQIQQGLQQTWEWVEYQFSRLKIDWPEPEVSPPSLSPLTAQIILWLALSALLVWLGLRLVHLLQPHWATFQQRSMPTATRKLTPSQISSAQEWLRKANQFQQQENYTEACRALYMAMLLQLDTQQLIPLEASRTDGEYKRLARPFSEAQLYDQILSLHEQLYFGNLPVTAATFHAAQDTYRRISATWKTPRL
jgi:hypothetical protein